MTADVEVEDQQPSSATTIVNTNNNDDDAETITYIQVLFTMGHLHDIVVYTNIYSFVLILMVSIYVF